MIVDIDSIKINERLREVNHSKAEEIAESIKEIGLINPITLSEDHTLIAGLHRLNAFKMLGYKQIEANIVSLTGLKQELAEIDENLIRHDLHYIDRGDHLKRRKEIYEDLHPETKQGQYGHKGKEVIEKPETATVSFSEDTSKKTGLSERTIERDIQISKSFTPEIKEQVKKADLSKTEALKLARLEPEKQKIVIEKAISEDCNIDDALKEIIKEERKDERIQKNIEEAKPIPEGKYNVIYSDPPWDIGSFVLEKWESPLDDKYSTLSLQELKDLNIESIKADNCVMFMWSTLTTIPDAIELLKHWGFKYHIMLTWDKGNGWSSTGFHRKSEVILVGYVGKITEVISQIGAYIPTVFYESKTKHSKKPDIMYNYLISNTKGKRIEMFARERREGFDCWGNEV